MKSTQSEKACFEQHSLINVFLQVLYWSQTVSVSHVTGWDVRLDAESASLSISTEHAHKLCDRRHVPNYFIQAASCWKTGKPLCTLSQSRFLFLSCLLCLLGLFTSSIWRRTEWTHRVKVTHLGFACAASPKIPHAWYNFTLPGY